MATTSSELGGAVLGDQGHKVAQFYGMFLWAGVALYVAIAWRVRADRLPTPEGVAVPVEIPSPHLAKLSARPATPRRPVG